MEKEKFKLLFYLKRGTQDKNGKSPIMGRISAGSSMVQFSCKCSCTPRLWDSRKNRLLGKSAEAVSVNKELDRLQVSIHKVYESLSGKSDAPITAERVRELVFGRPQLAYFNKKGHRMCAHKCVSAKRAVSRRTSNECVHINRSYYAYYKLNACWHSVGRTTL